MTPPGGEDAPADGTGDAARDFFTMFSDRKRSPSTSASPPEEEGNGALPGEAEISGSDGEDGPPLDSMVPPDYVAEEESPSPQDPVESIGIAEEEVSEGGDWWESLLNRMKKDGNVVLMGSMSKGKHRLEESRITLVFPSQFIAESIEREQKYIKDLIAQVMGKTYDLNIIIEKPKVQKEKKDVDEKVDLFVRIFGGTVVQDGTGGDA